MALTEVEKDQLFEHNVRQIDKMHVAAGSMVKGVIMELKRKNRNTYIRLRDAEEGGHVVFYDFVEGDKDLVFRIAKALGFKEVTDTKLEFAMLKKLLIAAATIAVVLMVALSYLTARYVDKEEIMNTKIRMAEIKAARDSIQALVAVKDSMQLLIRKQVHVIESEAQALREQVDLIEEQRQDDQLTVRKLNQPAALRQKLAETYPEMAYSDWGVTEVLNEEQDVALEYLLIPLWFSETFIIQDRNSAAYKEQVEKLQSVDSLQTEVTELNKSILQLEKDKSTAFEAGYDQAYAELDTVTKKYIKLLEKPPQIKFGIGSFTTGLAVGALGGGLVGSQIK